MKIDYFCFSVPNLNSNDYFISDEDDENLTWIKTKEKELMDSASKNNMLIVFDRSSKKFYIGNEEVDVKNKVVFPRSFIPYEEELLTQLESHGAISIQTKADLEKIENWPQKIQPVYRKVIQTSYNDFVSHVEDYKSCFKSIFFKTAKKTHTHCVLKYCGVIDFCGKKVFVTKPQLWDVSLEDTIFLSETFQSIKDEENNMDCKEYRAFILNNSLLSISRSYVDYPTEVPNDVIYFVEQQINRASSIPDFPNSYVLDVGQVLMDGREVIDIIEYNSISSSGLEVCNNLVDELVNNKRGIQYVRKKD